MPTQSNSVLMESFPFDSSQNGYDDKGYPVYDRAVGSLLLRSTFEKFFSNGVFPSPGNALNISKAASGLVVNIQPGICIINGAMGGVTSDDGYELLLDTMPPQGNVCYGIMLHFDLRQDYRGVYLTVVRGDAATSPTPPAPDQTTPGVYELRLGYVTVNSGAGDLSNATVVNEKGTSACPYAAPFEEIDVSGLVQDFRAQATDELNGFSNDLDTYRNNADSYIQQLIQDLNDYQGLLDSVLDDSTAGYLQQQITELENQLGDFDLTDSVDNVTIGYSQIQGAVRKVLYLMDGSVDKQKLAFGFDAPGGAATYESVESLSNAVAETIGDLAEIAYELDLNDMQSMELDTIIFFDFPGDVSSYQGQYDSSGVKYYAAPGTED